MFKIAILGAAGRMGEALRRLAVDSDDLAIVAAIDILYGNGDTDNDGIPHYQSIEAAPDFDVLIDFSSAQASFSAIDEMRRRKAAWLVASTGLTGEEITAIETLATQQPILIASNVSLGIAILQKLAATTAKILPSTWDCEIVEIHHKHKKDAPSGTALTIADRLRKAQPAYGANADHIALNRKREKGAIGIASLRGGSVAGEHVVHFMGPSERLAITHQAQSRDIFATAALTIAPWLAQQSPALYTIDDYIERSTDIEVNSRENDLLTALSLTCSAPLSDEDFDAHVFESTLLAYLEEAGMTTLGEQDPTTLDGSDLDDKSKRWLAYFGSDISDRFQNLSNEIKAIARRYNKDIVISQSKIHADSWQSADLLSPIQVSPRLAICSPKIDDFVPAAGSHVIFIEPGMAFGTGLHETTQLCLKRLDWVAQGDFSRKRVLDIGCGSGILSIAAYKLGFSDIVGIDNDPLTLPIAEKNARLNRVRASFRELSVDDISGSYDLVIVNMFGNLLLTHAEGILASVASGGTLILTGVWSHEKEAFIKSFTNKSSYHLNLTYSEKLGEFVLLQFDRGNG